MIIVAFTNKIKCYYLRRTQSSRLLESVFYFSVRHIHRICSGKAGRAEPLVAEDQPFRPRGIADGDSAGFLLPVLQGAETVVNIRGNAAALRIIDSKNTALFFDSCLYF